MGPLYTVGLLTLEATIMQIQSGIGLDKPHSRRAHESHDVLLGPTDSVP